LAHETQISQRQAKEIGLRDSHEELSGSPNEVTLTKDELVQKDREDGVRTNLKSDADTQRESEVHVSMVPQHVAVIMDGNRRYGKAKYGNVSKGHWDGSSKLVEFAKWCIAEKVSVLTVYAFSTENWNRDPAEVASLMAIFAKYSNELRVEALKRNIKMLVLSTDYDRVSAVHQKVVDGY
jgi:undecaprenyl pyrophosphate synthase